MDNAAFSATSPAAKDVPAPAALCSSDEFAGALAAALPSQLSRRLSTAYRSLHLSSNSERMRRASLRAYTRDAAAAVHLLRRRAVMVSGEPGGPERIVSSALALLKDVVDELAALPPSLRAERFSERRPMLLAVADTVASELVRRIASASRPASLVQQLSGEFDEWRSRMRSGLGTREWCLVFLYLRGAQGALPADLERWLPVHMHSPARKVVVSLQRQRVVLRREDGSWILTTLGHEEVRRRNLWDGAERK